MLKNTDIHIRDPFVLSVATEVRFYLYGTRGSEAWTDSARQQISGNTKIT